MLDPTWYGPKSITLAALEVDLASICASIPTFWPILSQRLLRVGGAGAGSIFVTQEVHITHQHRRLSSDDDENNKDSTATRYELQPAHSRADSTTSLGGASIARVASNKSSLTIARRNYHDDFGFGGGGGGGGAVPSIKEACVEAQVQSDGQRGYEREQERLRLAVVESNNSAQRR